MPEGSYFRYGAAGNSGSSMKLATIDSATNNAYMAILRVDQRPSCTSLVECGSLFGDNG
jgi:hypothetical protein